MFAIVTSVLAKVVRHDSMFRKNDKNVGVRFGSAQLV
jgi:hypothetical protein